MKWPLCLTVDFTRKPLREPKNAPSKSTHTRAAHYALEKAKADKTAALKAELGRA